MKVEIVKTLECDVLVVGGGVAGFGAAIGAAYCAHPVGLPLVEEGRYVPFIEQGKRSFKFRVGVY